MNEANAVPPALTSGTPAPTAQSALDLARIDQALDALIVQRSGEMLRWIALVMAVGTLALVFLNVRAGTPETLLTALTFLAMVTTVVVLTRLGRMRAAIMVFLWGSTTLAFVSAVRIGGLPTTVLVAVPMLVSVMGLMLPRRQALLLLGFSACGLIALAWAQVQELLPVMAPRPPLPMLMAYLLVCIIGALFGISTMTTLRDEHRRSMQLTRDLAEMNAGLDEQVAARTVELTAALTNLRETQDYLIQSEKLASLGSIVAGIAHELNTPIGNVRMVASTLLERAKELDEAMQSGKLSRSQLASGLGGVIEMSALIDRSSERAATLVSSFKQVAIDQVSERRRAFDLAEIVEENLDTLRPSYRTQPWQWINDVPPGIACDGYPGPLGQLLTNLMQNAAVHGFDGRSAGCVRISAVQHGERIELSVSDDGKGMDTATAARAFEPFFTTKLGKGGSGLGLSIVYRIATNILGGDIRAVSATGAGTRMIVTFPRQAPGRV